MPVKALLLIFGWRVAFLGINVGFGLSGIANKPAALQWQFILVGSGIDTLLIITAVYLYKLLLQNRAEMPLPGRLSTVHSVLAVLAGFGSQAFFLSL